MKHGHQFRKEVLSFERGLFTLFFQNRIQSCRCRSILLGKSTGCNRQLSSKFLGFKLLIAETPSNVIKDAPDISSERAIRRVQLLRLAALHELLAFVLPECESLQVP